MSYGTLHLLQLTDLSIILGDALAEAVLQAGYQMIFLVDATPQVLDETLIGSDPVVSVRLYRILAENGKQQVMPISFIHFR